MGFPVAVRTKDSSSDSMHIDSLETGLYLSNMIKSTYIYCNVFSPYLYDCI